MLRPALFADAGAGAMYLQPEQDHHSEVIRGLKAIEIKLDALLTTVRYAAIALFIMLGAVIASAAQILIAIRGRP
jgi:hypothetical protein